MLQRLHRISEKINLGGIFVKRPKSNQNLQFDMPVVGPETIKLACKAGLRGLVVSPQSVIVLDREKCIQIAEANDFFILAEETKIENIHHSRRRLW